MIYTVIINSAQKSSGTTSNGMYYFDWSVLPNVPYKVSFGFVSGPMNSVLSDVGLISIELGQSCVFNVTPTQIRGNVTKVIGSFIPNETNNTSSFVYGDHNTNGLVYLRGRPTQNEFPLKLLTLDGGLWVDSGNNQLGKFVLSLCFDDEV
jgi:hypothetical protein